MIAEIYQAAEKSIAACMGCFLFLSEFLEFKRKNLLGHSYIAMPTSKYYLNCASCESASCRWKCKRVNDALKSLKKIRSALRSLP